MRGFHNEIPIAANPFRYLHTQILHPFIPSCLLDCLYIVYTDCWIWTRGKRVTTVVIFFSLISKDFDPVYCDSLQQKSSVGWFVLFLLMFWGCLLYHPPLYWIYIKYFIYIYKRKGRIKAEYFLASSKFDFWVKVNSNFIRCFRIVYSRICKVNNFSKCFW